jgi:Glycosyltransferase like family 2
MRIEAVIVCVGYGDFLAATLPENLPLLDDVVIVTSPDDEETRAVCRKHSVHHVISNDHRRDGPFNKARMIQRGFDQIGGQDWVLHLDADIVLPRKFRKYAEWAHVDEQSIYGADRCNLTGWDEWQRLKHYAGAWDNHAHECGHWFHPKFPVGSRWVSKIHGYVPIGFFQMFHGSAMIEHGYHLRNYPLQHGDAARTDVQFALQWDRRKRQVLPEVVVLHLESETSALGANWKGRTTPRFGPPHSARKHEDKGPRKYPPSSPCRSPVFGAHVFTRFRRSCFPVRR